MTTPIDAARLSASRADLCPAVRVAWARDRIMPVSWAIAFLACAFGVVACKAKVGASCVRSGDCQSGLDCEEERCATCSDTKGCKTSGLCGPRQADGASGCIATDDGCRASSACTTNNRCHALGPNTQLCVSKGDDCASTKDCKEWGRCTPNRDGTCSAGSNDGCKAAEVCRTLGHCTVKDGHCAAGSDQDCKALASCTVLGHCSAKDGECIAERDADCGPD